MSTPTEELVSLCANSYFTMNFKNMELIILARLNFNLAAPTPAFYLGHLVAVEDEKDWSEDLSRHLMELVMEDRILARVSPSLIAQSVFNVLKVCWMVINIKCDYLLSGLRYHFPSCHGG